MIIITYYTNTITMECPICLTDIIVSDVHFKITNPDESALYHEECMKEMLEKFGRSLIERTKIVRVEQRQNGEVINDDYIFPVPKEPHMIVDIYPPNVQSSEFAPPHVVYQNIYVIGTDDRQRGSRCGSCCDSCAWNSCSCFVYLLIFSVTLLPFILYIIHMIVKFSS